MPEPENGWLFGEQSSAFKTTRWTKRKNTEPVSKETLKALTATILEYGPDAVSNFFTVLLPLEALVP